MRGFYEAGLAVTGRAFAAGVKVLVGTDGGDSFVFPGSSVHDEMAELVKAGLTPAQALAAATVRSAEFLGLQSEYGTVAAGRRADLVLLAGNPLTDIGNTRRIDAVVLGGRVLSRRILDDMLAEVARVVAAQ
jgi:imidazolonepropionase-like amidohydrolase